MLKLSIRFLFFSSIVYYSNTDVSAQDIYQKYCFRSLKESTLVQEKLMVLKINNEVIDLNKNCVDIFIFSKRESLYSKYIRMNFPNARFINDQIENKVCKIEIRKELKNNIQNTQIKISHKPNLQNFTVSKDVVSTSQLNILNGKMGALQVGLNNYQIKCRAQTEVYNLDISISDPKINLTTSIALKENSDYDLGQFNQKVNNERKRLGLPVELESLNSIKEFRYIIRLRP